MYIKFDIGDFYPILSKKFKFGYNRAKISDSLHEEFGTFFRCHVYSVAVKALSSSEMVSGC